MENEYNTKTIEYSRDGTINKITIEKGIDRLLFEYNYYRNGPETNNKYIVLTQKNSITIKRQNDQTLVYEVCEEVYIIEGGLE